MSKYRQQSIYSVRRIVNALVFALQGLRIAWKHEAAFRQEVVACFLLLPLAFWLADNTIQFSLLVGSMLLVLIVEILNSAIEAVVDRIGPEKHELSGNAKDLGGAAVLLAIVLAMLVWSGVIFY